jgi:hypothetical protein
LKKSNAVTWNDLKGVDDVIQELEAKRCRSKIANWQLNSV